MRHLHCADDWLDLFVHNLFNDSLLEPVLNHVDCFSVFSTCFVIFWNLTTFTTTCGSLVSTICSTTRFGILERVVPLACSEQLRLQCSCWTSWITSTTLSTTVRFCTRFMMRNSDGFLRHLRNHDVDGLFNDDALLNSLLRCRSDIRSCGITLAFLPVERRSPARPCRRPSPSVPQPAGPSW